MQRLLIVIAVFANMLLDVVDEMRTDVDDIRRVDVELEVMADDVERLRDVIPLVAL